MTLQEAKQILEKHRPDLDRNYHIEGMCTNDELKDYNNILSAMEEYAEQFRVAHDLQVKKNIQDLKAGDDIMEDYRRQYKANYELQQEVQFWKELYEKERNATDHAK